MERELSKFQGQLQVAYEINHILPQLLKEHYDKGAKSALDELAKLTDDERIQLLSAKNDIEGLMKGEISVTQFKMPSEKIRKIMLATMQGGESALNNYSSTIRNMVLSYLISKFEDLVAVYLKIVFMHKPEALYSKEKTLTYEEILKHDSVESLRVAIIYKEVDGVLRKSIEKIDEYLLTKFGFELSARPNWNKLTESIYRRNCIIHNDSLPNIDYMQKFRPESRLMLLDANEKYLDDIANVLNAEAKAMKTFFIEKFQLPRDA